MEQWLNLLIQVAKPILTSLAYTGTNMFLDVLQTEIKNEQNKHKKLALKSLGLNEKKINIIEQVINNTNFNIELDTDEKSLVIPKQEVAESLATNKEDCWLQLNQQAQENNLKLPEIKKILEHWPLKLFPSQLISSKINNFPTPLRIVIVPPRKIFQDFKAIGIEVEEIEERLSQNLREFLSQNYSSHCSVKPTEFLGGAWNNNNFYGEASIKVLFAALPTEPTLILETAIEGNYIIFRLGYWGRKQNKYCYETIFKLPYRTLIEASIKTRALKWREIKNKLLELGKSPEEIAKLGKDNVINLALLEEIEKLEAAGIETKKLDFPYQVNQEDFEYICQFVSICQCLVAGWIVDLHYLIEDDVSPHLSEWLPQLGQSLGKSEFLPTIIRASISLYQGIFRVLAKERTNYIPRLTLELAHSLRDLDPSLAREQLESSWQSWLQQHQISPTKAKEKLEAIQGTIKAEDWEYLVSFQTCLSALETQITNTPMQELIAALSDRHPLSYSQKGEHFALDYTITEISGQVFCLWLDSTSCKLIAKNENKTLALWELKRRKVQLSPTYQLKGYSGKAIAITLSPDGQRLVSSDTTQKRSYIRIWNLQTGKLERTLFGHKQVIYSLAVKSEDDSFLVSGSHKIKVWDLRTGESRLTLFGHKQLVYSLAIAPDGQTLVSGSEDKTIRIWNLCTGNLCRTLTGHQASVRVVAIASDSKTLVSGSDDSTIKLWDLQTGKLLSTLTGHTGGIRALAISPDCQYIVSGSEDKTIKIWHFSSEEVGTVGEVPLLRQTLLGHEETIRTLAIHPDGRTIASGSDDKTIKFWRIL
jgi:WD40 repeat protein